MKSTITKISVTTLFTAVFFVVAFAFTSTVSAQISPDSGTGCTGCGGSTGGTTVVGGGSTSGGGGTTTVIPAPVCDIKANKEFVNPGEQYTISWANGSVGSYKVGGVAVERTGFLTYTWNADNIFLTFTVTGVNSSGVTCSDTVTVYRYVEAPVCDITTNLTAVSDGQSFKISWNGTPTHSTVFKVNNQIVAASDSQTYTWPAGRTTPVTVTMTGKNAKGVCTDSVTVNPVTHPVVNPICDSFTANPTSIVRGNSATLTWATTNATGVSINNGVGVVAVDGSKVVTPTNTITYILTATRDAKSVTCPVTVTVTDVPAPIHPICDSFTSNPTSIVRGNSATLTWATTNATGVSINNGIGAVAVDGTRVVTPTNTTTYTLTATRDAKSVSCPVTVTVTDAPTPSPICDSFSSNPTSIVRGNSATLTWATTNATEVSINNGIGAVAVDGTRSVSPTNTTTYTLTATRDAKTVTCHTTVTVTDVPTPVHPICDSFTASPTTIDRGQSSKLTWSTTNATAVTINNAVGTVAVDGNIDVTPLQSTTYTLTATRDDKSVTCSVPVTVKQPENPTPITCAANVNFSASPSSIREGNNSTLTWNTTGVDTVRINNDVNSTAVDGSEVVSPQSDTTYTLTATKGNDTINCPVTINVDEDNGGGGGGGSSSPKCTLKISDNKISLGERVTIKWDTTRATEVTLKDNHGKTLVDTDDKSSSEKKDLYDGEITIRPEKDTTYTLVAEKGSRDKTCKVSVDVEDTVVVTQVRDQQPLVTGIALTNVPYTGFEAGSFMTTMFYGLLALWALYMAYVLVGRRNGMNVSAFTPSMVTADIVPANALFPESVTPAPVFYQAAAPVASTTAVVGYEAHTEIASALEAQAHAAHVLVSADALAYFIAATADEDRAQILTGVLAAAKASYPSEGGWVTVTADRMIELAKSN